MEKFLEMLSKVNKLATKINWTEEATYVNGTITRIVYERKESTNIYDRCITDGHGKWNWTSQ